MKRISLLTALVCLSVSIALSQKISSDKVPAAVKAGLTKQFPKAEKAKWEMEKSDFEVNFTIGKTQWSAVFDSAGTVMETEETVTASALPKAVTESVKKEFPGYKIELAEKMTKGNAEPVYEIELEKKEQSVEIQITSAGKILSKKVEDGKEGNEGKEKEKD